MGSLDSFCIHLVLCATSLVDAVASSETHWKVLIGSEPVRHIRSSRGCDTIVSKVVGVVNVSPLQLNTGWKYPAVVRLSTSAVCI